MFSCKIKEIHTNEKGKHLVAVRTIESREYLIKVPFDKCIRAPVYEGPLTSWHLVKKAVTMLDKFPSFETYKAIHPIFKPISQILEECKASKMNHYYIFLKLLIEIRKIICMIIEEERLVPGDEHRLLKSSFLHAWMAVASRCWFYDDEYFLVPQIENTNNSFFGNCVTRFNKKKQVVTFQANRHIEPGEELTHTYSQGLYREKIYLTYYYVDSDFPNMSESRHLDEVKEKINLLATDELFRVMMNFIKHLVANGGDKPLITYYIEYLLRDVQTNIALDLCMAKI